MSPRHSEISGAGDLEPASRRAAMHHAMEVLERRHGPRWREIPTGLGRPSARAAALLGEGPTAVRDETPVSEVVSRAVPLVDAAVSLTELVAEEAEVLGEALGCDLAELRLDRLADLAGAVMDLGLVKVAEPTWAEPAAANAAHLVLVKLEDRLRTTAELHRALYADFTEHVLDFTDLQLRAGAQRWRPVARAQLRRRLAGASRTSRVRGDLPTVARNVREVLESRRWLAELAPLLTTHFGPAGWSPLTDVDAVGAALATIRRFQSVLGDGLAPDRLAALVSAGAFASSELVQPATNLRVSLDRWRLAVTTVGGGLPFALTSPELATWAARTRSVLPAITSGAAAMVALDQPPASLRALVDDLLLRERVAELAVAQEREADDHPCYAGPRSAS